MARTLFAACAALLIYTETGAVSLDPPGTPATVPRSEGVQRARERATAKAAQRPGTSAPKQILFGDLHVHTTVSYDAFVWHMPVFGGDGAAPQADACDFARHCSSLDFFALTDHAESMPPRQWRATKDAIRQCNAVAGHDSDPDLVAFVGWEWTQMGATPDTHYGHKNVILRDVAEERLPARPIASRQRRDRDVPALNAIGGTRARDYEAYMAEIAGTPVCADGKNVRELPADCMEIAGTAGELFRRLREWDLEMLVIPHGSAWGYTNPIGADWAHQLNPDDHDPSLQRLIEVYSGHGNSESYREWREVVFDALGERRCPAATHTYEPLCHRAGVIIRERCMASGGTVLECSRREQDARQRYLATAGGFSAGWLVVPNTSPNDWLGAGECLDCFLPAGAFRPLGSVQYLMSASYFGAEHTDPLRYRFGFVGSSDDHGASPGGGYKELQRWKSISVTRMPSDAARSFMRPPATAPAPESRVVDLGQYTTWQTYDVERASGMAFTGGLAAVHAEGRSREAIWDALKRREVYATSGERILLWFDLLPDRKTRHPMGSEVVMSSTPRFEVRAAGSFRQSPGCPPETKAALGAKRTLQLCRGECYHPTGDRHRISRIEVIRIYPQATRGEPVGDRIEDVWKTLPCDDRGEGCTAQFEDPEFATRKRDVLYYVRAIQEPTLVINGAGVRCRYDAEGRCVEVNVCGGDPRRTAPTDDCLAPAEERAWSSPIFVNYRRQSPDAGK
jgi:hypothetical protein